jgi:hypothetical protein
MAKSTTALAVSAAVLALLSPAAFAGEGKIEVKLSVEPAEIRVPAKGSFSFTVSLDVKNSGDAAVKIVPPSPGMVEIRDGAGGQLKFSFKGSDASRMLAPGDFPELAPGASVALKLSGFVFDSGKLSLTAPTGGWWEASPDPAPGKLTFSAVYSNDKASIKLGATLVGNIWTGSLRSNEAVLTLVRGEAGVVRPELVLQGRTSLINDVTLLVVNSDEEWKQATKLCFCAAGVKHWARESRLDPADGAVQRSSETSLWDGAPPPGNLAKQTAVFILPGRADTPSAQWAGLGRCAEEDGLLVVHYGIQQVVRADKAIANPSPFCIAFIPKTSKPVAFTTGGKMVATVGAGCGGDVVNGLQLRLKAARTQYRLSAKEPLEMAISVANVSARTITIVKRRSHVDMSVSAVRASGAEGFITSLLPPEPPPPLTADDLKWLKPGEIDESENASCEMLGRINQQLRAGNGRAGVFEVSVSCRADTSRMNFDRNPQVWNGSLRSNAARVSLIPEETWTRLEAMRKSPEAFSLSLKYYGPQEQPEPCAMFVHEKAAPKFQPGFVAPPTGISTAEILRVIDALAMNEKLWHTGAIQRRRAVAEPGYGLSITWGEQGSEYLVDACAMGVGLDASACLRELNAALDAAHRRPIDMILGRLAVHRVIAEKEAQKSATAAPAAVPPAESRQKSPDEQEAF